MKLLEINPEKRISALEALEHPFLSESSTTSVKNSEEIYNIDAEEGHALKLYDTTNHEYFLITKMFYYLKATLYDFFSFILCLSFILKFTQKKKI